MIKRVATSLIATMIFSSAAHAQIPVPNAGTTLSDVTVVGGKIMPTTEDPKSATCEFLVAIDPGLRAQIDAARKGGDPFFMADIPGMAQDAPPASEPSALYAGSIFQPTRFPLEVDRAAAPLTPPGSALPGIARQYRGVTTRSATGADVATETGSSRLYDLSTPEMVATLPQFSVEDAIGACRSLRALGGAAGVDWSQGKYEIAYRDKALPTAFALFEDRRYAESLDYFHRAFDKLSYDQGGDEAALMIGKLMLGAPGVQRDTTGALGWLKKAAGARFDNIADMPVFDPREPDRNTAIGEAAMILARLYQTGAAGVAKDPQEARRWFERALEVGHVPAAVVLGDIYYYGAGAQKDLKKAFDYYRQGAILRHAPAQNALADMYLAGEAPGGRNFALALAWRTEAARLGNSRALFELATAYDTGDGVAADSARALTLYKLAAVAGSAAAKNAIGTYFYDGRGLAKDPALARRWFEQAAVAGDPDAMFNLGAMMIKGEGGEIDRTHAWFWLKIAEKGENPNAAAAVRVLERGMTSDERAAATKLLSPTNS